MMVSGKQAKRLLAELVPDGALASDLTALRSLLVPRRDASEISSEQPQPPESAPGPQPASPGR